MEKVKVTIEIPVERLGALADFLIGPAQEKRPIKEEPVPVPEEPAVVAAPSEPEPDASAKVTKADLRALGVELTKAGKKEDVVKVFAKYGAENLTTLDEKYFSEAKKDLEALR